MPNIHNIKSPITLISFGRSGTSLISDIFDRHPQSRHVGETTNLLFGTWRAVEAASGVIQPLIEDNIWISDDDRAGSVVRQAYLACFPDKQLSWFQKPIGIPNGLVGWSDENYWSEAASWYWKVVGHSFPEAKCFTILRHPCDVVLSAKSYWGYDEAALWQSLGFMAYLLMHPDSLVQYAVHFEELAQNREGVVRELFDYLELPFHDQVLEAFSQIHAPSKRTKLDSSSPWRNHEWGQLDPKCLKPSHLSSLKNLFNRFNYDLEFPEHLVEFSKPDQISVSNWEPTKEELEEEVTKLRGEIDRLHQKYMAKLQEGERLAFNKFMLLQPISQPIPEPPSEKESSPPQPSLDKEIQQWQQRLKEQEVRIRQLENTLYSLYKTRAWRLISKYWTFKEKLRALYRTMVPYKLRIAFRYLRHPQEKFLLQELKGQTKSSGPAVTVTRVTNEANYSRPESAMKIVYLCWTAPYPLDSGGKIRSYHMLRYLAERHEVHVHVPSWPSTTLPDDIKKLFASFTFYHFNHVRWKQDHRFRLVKGIPRNLTGFYTTEAVAEFQKTVSSQEVDLIVVDESVMAAYAWPFHQIPSILARQKAEHLFYADVYRRTPLGKEKLKALIEALLYKFYERRLWHRFKDGIVVSEEERKLYLELEPTLNLAIIPNGVDTLHFQPTPLPDCAEPTIIFQGLMSFYPNVDAALWFEKDIFPLILKELPKTKFLIAGRDPVDEIKQLARPEQVIVTGGVPDMRDYLQCSHLVIVPLRIGHGTRLKILEAMGVGRPVVSTSIGAEGITAKTGESLLLADNPADFAACVVKVLTDRRLAEQLALNGRQLVENYYSWESIGERLEQFCQTVANRTSSL